MLRTSSIGFIYFAMVLFCRHSSGQSVTLPDGQQLPSVDFDRHVAPLLSKLGCNSGSCHGNSEGKGGFRLSLFGSDTQLDYASITAAASGRVDLARPCDSLLLQKPSMAIDHGGGERFSSDSWEYEVLLSWIASGASKRTDPNELLDLELSPRVLELTEDQPIEHLRVLATFPDGERVDVTQFAGLRVDDESVAALEHGYTIRRASAGDTVVVATYAGRPASARVLVPHAPMGDASIEAHPNDAGRENVIDHFIAARTDRLNIKASPPSSDEVFFRRVTLATTGQLPSVEAVKRFLKDSDVQKRERAIARLLADPLHASLWATRFCEILGSRDTGSSPMAPVTAYEEKWHAWLRVRFERNEPYDVMARQILCATTRDGQPAGQFVDRAVEARAEGKLDDAERYAARDALDLFWQRHKANEEVELESIAERVASAFLGVRVECAKCHKHPFDRWTQEDFRSFQNIFSQVRYGMSDELRLIFADKLQEQRDRVLSGRGKTHIPALREVYLADTPRDLGKAQDGATLAARPLGGRALATTGDRREEFVRWLTAESNPYFARSIVNRVWEFYFGRGIVEPVDAFSSANPPTHPELLDALADRFVDSGYDIQKLEQLILSSSTWQRSAEADATIGYDTHNYARFYVRVLPAYAVADSLSCALGDGKTRAASVATFEAADEELRHYFEIFSRPQRQSTCDCERNAAPTLRQAMLLLSDEQLASRIHKSMGERVADISIDDRNAVNDLIDDIFLRSLCRWPSEAERQLALERLAEVDDLHQASCDMMWSLVNTREFITMH